MKFEPRKIISIIHSLHFTNFLLFLLILLTAWGSLPMMATRRFVAAPPRAVFSHPVFLALLATIAVLAGLYALSSFLRRTPASSRNSSNGTEKKKNWGGALLHFGIVFILLGGLVTFLFSNFRDLEIEEGQTHVLKAPDLKIKLEKFSIFFHSGTSTPQEYVSSFLIQNDKKTYRKELGVNAPIRIRGIKIFQMRYNWKILEIAISVFKNGQYVGAANLVPGKRQAFSWIPFWLETKEVIPDFAIDSQGNVSSRSQFFNNPAVQIMAYSDETRKDPLLKGWAFSDVFHHEKDQPPEWSFAIDKIKKHYISGLRVAEDPGAPVFYLGLILLVSGAFVSSFVSRSALPGSFETFIKKEKCLAAASE